MAPALRHVAAVLALLVAFIAAPVLAAPEYPAFTGLVVDAANVLTPQDQAELTRKLEDLEQKTGVQFAVATIPSLGGEEIEPYANALFRRWKVGERGVNNGLLLLLAPNERKLRFEVGYGLEGTMTDAQSKLILRNDMVPKLKAGDPAGALKVGVDDALEVLTKDKANLPERLKVRPASQQGDPQTAIFITVFILAFVLIWIFGALQNRRRGRGWSSGWTWGGPGGFIVGGGSGLGDSGSSSSDSGFSGGGGGDSGGGGASDSY